MSSSRFWMRDAAAASGLCARQASFARVALAARHGGSEHVRWRSPARGSGANHFLHTEHGRFLIGFFMVGMIRGLTGACVERINWDLPPRVV